MSRQSPNAYRIELNRRRRAFSFPSRPVLLVIRAVLADHDAPPGVLSICVVGDREMRSLNEAYSGTSDTTDVLAFPLADLDDPTIGEIIVNADRAAREGPRYDNSPQRELSLYVVHGALHLVGYDDHTPAEKRRMRRAERKYLHTLDLFSESPHTH